ncbi:hypothetical protein ACFC1R_34395 [Kitasatospora sp. NPDC056138]|uniref:hypothetical protein n=1 Tax=Kitasatospora sp. NPDC056138 TaxID=3345724 RepID=UPI0035DC49B1
MSGGEAGWLYDYWDGTKNCSVFVKTEYAGTKTWTNLSIHNSAGVSGDHDYGYFTTYAGPVRVNGVGVCVSEFVAENDLNGNQFVNWMSGNHGC